MKHLLEPKSVDRTSEDKVASPEPNQTLDHPSDKVIDSSLNTIARFETARPSPGRSPYANALVYLPRLSSEGPKVTINIK